MLYKEELYENFVRDFSIILRNKTRNLELSKLIFLCIGTDRVIGDSFGPIVGSKLESFFKTEENIDVIGTLENTINMNNISNTIKKIYKNYETPFLIVIDAALSNKIDIGRIVVSKEKMNIGGGFKKSKIFIGDISLKGIVAKDLRNLKLNFKLLQNSSLRFSNEYGRYCIFSGYIM